MLLPFPKDTSSSSGSHVSAGDSDMSLVCVARRIPQTDRTPSNTQVEQFSTRLDLTGKILAIDTSYASSNYSQYLNKDLIGKTMLELCHPGDFKMLNGHFKDALQSGSFTTSGVYRLKMATDRFVCIQTKSKLFRGATPNEQHIMAAHSIIRDSESTSNMPPATHSVVANTINTSTSASSATSSSICPPSGDPLPGSVHSESPSTSAVSSLTSSDTVSTTNVPAVSASYSDHPGYAPLSPSTNVNTSDLLNDCLGLSEMFPSSSWSDFDTNEPNSSDMGSMDQSGAVSASTGGNDNAPSEADETPASHAQSSHQSKQVPSSLSSLISPPPPSYTPTNPSNATAASIIASTNTTTTVSSGGSASGSGNRSPARAATPSSATTSPRAPTPFGSSQAAHNQSIYSPVQKSSPAHTPNPVPSPSVAGQQQGGTNGNTHKLRNLLTQGAEAPVNSHNSSGGGNQSDILRDLLNHEDDDDEYSFSGPSSAPAGANPSTPFGGHNTPTSNSNVFSFDANPMSCPPTGSDKNKSAASKDNNMLRKLLGDEESGKSYQHLQSLLKVEPADSRGSHSYPSTPSSNMPPSHSDHLTFTRYGASSTKRKSVDEHYGEQGSATQGSQPGTPQGNVHFEYSANKRPAMAGAPNGVQMKTQQQQQLLGNNGQQGTQHLAAKNPRLASMLAQAPGLPAAPVSIPTSIVSQVPQERLPKNLEKKLQHTPAGLDGTVVVSSHIVTSAAGGNVMTLSSAAGPQQQFIISQLQPMHHVQRQPGQAVLSNVQHVGGQRFQLQSGQPDSAQMHSMAQPTASNSGFLNKMLLEGNRPTSHLGQQGLVNQPAGAYYNQHPHPVQTPQTPQTHGPGLSTSGGQLIRSHAPALPVPNATTPSTIAMYLDSQGAMNIDAPPDPDLSDILDQVWSMQEELHIDGTPVSRSSQGASQAVSGPDSSSSHADELLKILDEVLEPTAPNIAVPSTPVQSIPSTPNTPGTPVGELSEKLAISAIQRQLMSFESQGSSMPLQQQTNRPQVHPLYGATAPQQQSAPYTATAFQGNLGPPPAYSASHQQQQQQQQLHQQGPRRTLTNAPTQLIQHRPSPSQPPQSPHFGHGPSTPGGGSNLSQPPSPAAMFGPTGPGIPLAPQNNLRKPMKGGDPRMMAAMQQDVKKQLLQQQKHQEMTCTTPQESAPFDNLADMLNNSVSKIVLLVEWLAIQMCNENYHKLMVHVFSIHAGCPECEYSASSAKHGRHAAESPVPELAHGVISNAVKLESPPSVACGQSIAKPILGGIISAFTGTARQRSLLASLFPVICST